MWSIIGSRRCVVTHSNEKHLEVSRTQPTSLATKHSELARVARTHGRSWWSKTGRREKVGWGLIIVLGVPFLILKSIMLTFTCRWYRWSYLSFTQKKHTFSVATWMRYLLSFQKQSGSWTSLSFHHSLYCWCHLSLADEETFESKIFFFSPFHWLLSQPPVSFCPWRHRLCQCCCESPLYFTPLLSIWGHIFREWQSGLSWTLVSPILSYIWLVASQWVFE